MLYEVITFVEPPFRIGPLRPDGLGLNPQLKNYWMMIHPPTLYIGYVAFTIPFAFAIAALITRRTGDIWFRITSYNVCYTKLLRIERLRAPPCCGFQESSTGI